MEIRFTDQQYLTTDQYKDSSNLDARIAIHQRFSTNSQGWFNWVFDVLEQLPEKANIVELGCGPAVLWKECASRIPDGWVVTLTDLSDGMLDAAWRNLVPLGVISNLSKWMRNLFHTVIRFSMRSLPTICCIMCLTAKRF